MVPEVLSTPQHGHPRSLVLPWGGRTLAPCRRRVTGSDSLPNFCTQTFLAPACSEGEHEHVPHITSVRRCLWRMDSKHTQMLTGGDKRAEEEVKKGPLCPVPSPPRAVGGPWGGPSLDKTLAVGRRAGCWQLAPPTANLEGKPEEAT